MAQKDYVLNLTLDTVGVVHLHADETGLDRLISTLQSLKAHLAKGECEHEHMMSEDWGGYGLSLANSSMAEGHLPVHHLKIYAWTDEWARKNGFNKRA